MELIASIIEQYAQRFTTAESELLQQVAADTSVHHAHAHMLSGHVQGRFLAMVSRLIRPKRVLEIGTFTGYSALCLAEGLAPDGVLHTIELREADAATAARNFNLSAVSEKIILHVGNALEVIPTLNEAWDLVFIDADKTAYADYYQLLMPGLRKNALLIADNVLFHGQVVEDPIKGKNALAIDAFNRMVADDQRCDSVLLTVRDGLMLILKN
jgi:caffeoyl-CoA O-methyltransferase